jgi:microcystin-dependent protein
MGIVMQVTIGSIVQDIGYNLPPNSYIKTDGRVLKISEYPELFNIVRWLYSDKIDANWFHIPNIPGYLIKVKNGD